MIITWPFGLLPYGASSLCNLLSLPPNVVLFHLSLQLFWIILLQLHHCLFCSDLVNWSPALPWKQRLSGIETMAEQWLSKDARNSSLQPESLLPCPAKGSLQMKSRVWTLRWRVILDTLDGPSQITWVLKSREPFLAAVKRDVCGVRKWSSFILLQVVDQFSQHHLLTRLS